MVGFRIEILDLNLVRLLYIYIYKEEKYIYNLGWGSGKIIVFTYDYNVICVLFRKIQIRIFFLK